MITLETAKKLQEVVKKKNITLQGSIPNYSTDELFDMLPAYIETPVDKEKCRMYIYKDIHWGYITGYFNFYHIEQREKTISEALALLLIDLLEKDIIKKIK